MSATRLTSALKRFVFLVLINISLFASVCAMAVPADVVVVIAPNKIVRESVPPTLFGFNIELSGFDYGYMRAGVLRRDLIAMLKPFEGAIYRYPGGTVSSYFDWRKSIGPHIQRPQQVNQWGQKLVTQFGFDEYRSFLQDVGGVPIIVVNFWGEKAGAWPARRIVKQAEDWLLYANGGKRIDPNRVLQPCLPTTECLISIWELGNEMDWGEQSLSAEKYGALAAKVAFRLKNIDPGLYLLIGGMSAPWSPGRRLLLPSYEKTIGHYSTDLINGLSLHSYYDGIKVPIVLERILQAATSFDAGRGRGAFDIFVTEHARWPKRPKIGDWKSNWHQTTDISGALSTADFWLGVMPNPKIIGLAWHALAANGPWQLFSISNADNSLIPSATYWAFRVLRSGFLDKVVSTQVIALSAAGYAGGYDVRAIAMRSSDGRSLSVLAVNRSSREQLVQLVIPDYKDREVKAVIQYIGGPVPELKNDEENPFRIEMRKNIIRLTFDSSGATQLSLPRLSVVSIMLNEIPP